jgi:hypothetical protein
MLYDPFTTVPSTAVIEISRHDAGAVRFFTIAPSPC